MLELLQTPAMTQVGRIKISGIAMKKLRLKMAMTQAEFGERIGLKIARMGKIESEDESGIYPQTLRRLAELMGVSPEEAIKQLAPKTPRIEQSIGDPVRRGIPLINKTRAGAITDYHECNMADSGQGHWYVSRDGIEDPHAFAVAIVGDSMTPTLSDGSIAIFSPMGPDGHTLHKRIPVPEGHIVFVRFGPDAPAEGCTIARLSRSGKKLLLTKDNPKHKAIPADPAHIVNMGALVRYDPPPGMTKMFHAGENAAANVGEKQTEGKIHPDHPLQKHPDYDGPH